MVCFLLGAECTDSDFSRALRSHNSTTGDSLPFMECAGLTQDEQKYLTYEDHRIDSIFKGI